MHDLQCGGIGVVSRWCRVARARGGGAGGCWTDDPSCTLSQTSSLSQRKSARSPKAFSQAGVSPVARMAVPPERLRGRAHTNSPRPEGKGRLLHPARHAGLRARRLGVQLLRCGRRHVCVQMIAAASAAGCSARARRHAHVEEEEKKKKRKTGW